MVCFSNVDFTHGCLIYMTPYVQQLYTRDPLTLLEIESHSQGVLRLNHCAISQAAMWFSICHYLTFRGWNFHVAQPIIFRWVCLIFCIIDELPFRPNRHEKDPSHRFIPRVTQAFEQVFPSALYFVLLVSEPFHCLQLWRTKAGLLCNNISRMKIAFSLPVIALPSILDFLALIYSSKGNMTYSQGQLLKGRCSFDAFKRPVITRFVVSIIYDSIENASRGNEKKKQKVKFSVP